MKIVVVLGVGVLVWAIAECWMAHQRAQHFYALYMQTLARLPQRGKRGRFVKR